MSTKLFSLLLIWQQNTRHPVGILSRTGRHMSGQRSRGLPPRRAIHGPHITPARKYLYFLAGVIAIAGLALPLDAVAQPADVIPPAESDPVERETMVGFPPPPERLVTRTNVLQFPKIRWAFHNMRELVPTANVWNGPAGHVAKLDEDTEPVAEITFTDREGRQHTVASWLEQTYTDGFLVLHAGDIAFEYYDAGMRPRDPHILWSVTKSMTGLLAADLIASGELDPSKRVAEYIPELADSAWGDATVQQTLDMTTAVRFTEKYDDPQSDIYRYTYAGGILVAPEGYEGPMSMYAYLPTLEKQGEHGERFTYRTVNSEVLGWIIQRISGRSFNELLSARIWQPMGAQFNAYAWVDSHGTELMGAGMNATLRDLARFADMVRNHGRYNGQAIIAPEAIEDIFAGGDRDKYAEAGYTGRVGYSYHNQWWVTHNDDGAIEAWGIHGQIIHINPADEVVIVKLSSRPTAGNGPFAGTAIEAFRAIGDALAGQQQ